MRHGRAHWHERLLLAVGILCLGVFTKNWTEAAVFQSRQSSALDAGLHAGSAGSNDAGSRPRHGRVLGRIEIPRLRVSAIIAEGTDPALLNSAIGHVVSTALPGHAGNCALAGHRDTFLRGLEHVRARDRVRIVTLHGTYTYEVQWARVVAPNRVDMLDRTDGPAVTLITCFPFHLIGPAPDRFAVRARLVAVSEPGLQPRRS